MDWQPITEDQKDGKRRILDCGPKARYRIIIGKWNPRMREWQSDPGAWPSRPIRWMDLPPV